MLISLGSNIEPEKNLPLALKMLAEGALILNTASIWQTPAIGSDGPDYLNTAVLMESHLPPDQLKVQLLSAIEGKLGRTRTSNKNADRTIDLDVLMFDGECRDEELWGQAHVAVPASELLPDCTNPQSGETLANAAKRLSAGSSFIKRTDLMSNDEQRFNSEQT